MYTSFSAEQSLLHKILDVLSKKTAEGHTKGAREPNAALRTGVENHWSTLVG